MSRNVKRILIIGFVIILFLLTVLNVVPIYHFIKNNYIWLKKELDKHHYEKWVEVASKGQVSVIRKMADDGVNINAIGKGGMTPLFWVGLQKPVNMVTFKALLENGGDPNTVVTRGKYIGMSATYLAASRHKPKMLNAVLAYGGDQNIRYKKSHHQTALLAAVNGGYLSEVKMLIKNAANIDAVDTQRVSPILAAAYHKRYDIAYYLLMNGADYRAKGYLIASEKSSLADLLVCSYHPALSGKQKTYRDKIARFIKARGILVGRAIQSALPSYCS